ncbi:MAG: hypothetical protein DRG39_06085, partial [Deltaproteobacteria bacterium]
MKKINLAFFILSITFLFVTGGDLRAELCNKIVAIVNNDIITLYELNKRIKEMTGKDPLLLQKYDKDSYKKACYKVLNILIDNKIANKKAKELKLKVSDSDVDEEIKRIERSQGISNREFLEMIKKNGMTYNEYRDQVKKSIVRMQLVEFEVKSRIIINDKKIKEYYETHKDEFKRGEKIRLGSIFLKSSDPNNPAAMQSLMRRAEVIISRLRAGQDFAELAEQFSEGPGADNGGDLGYFEPKELDPQLRKVVEKMNVGDISGPIIRPFGIQIIRLLDRKKGGTKPLKEVRDYIYRILYNKEIDKRYSSWI